MDSSKFSVQTSLEANYLNIELEEDAAPDEIAMRVIKEDCPDFLVPFRQMNRNDKNILKYKLPNAVSLEYGNLTLSAQKFAELYLSLLTPFVKGKDWFLDYHCLCIDPLYVYLGKDLGKAYFIYIPEESCRNRDEEIMGFFRDILSKVEITGESAFMLRLYQYFNRGSITLADLYQMTCEECKKPGKDRNASSDIQEMRGGYGSAQGVSATASSAYSAGASVQAKNAAFPAGMFSSQQMHSADSSASGAAFTQEDPEEEKPKKKSLFGGGKKKKETQEKVELPIFGQESDLSSGVSEEDEVMAALFGDKKKKEKKEKAPKEPKEKAVKQPKAEKGGIFGSKKKQTVQSESGMQGASSNFGGGFSGQPAAQVSGSFSGQSIAQGSGGFSRQHAVQGNGFSGQSIAQGGGFSIQQGASGGNFGAYMQDTDGVTEIVGDGVPQENGFLELIESPFPGAPARISLTFDKPFITVGRISANTAKPDIVFDNSFKRIGRMHARIEKREGVFYVIDLGSANHTLLDGEILAPNQPYPLQNGSILSFTASQPVRYRVNL